MNWNKLFLVTLIVVNSAAHAEQLVSECAEVRGVGYNPATGTYLIPYPSGNTRWGFSCENPTPRAARSPLFPGTGVKVALCETPIQLQYDSGGYAVAKGYGVKNWTQGCKNIREVIVRPAGPSCAEVFPALQCHNPRGIRLSHQISGRLIPGYPTQNIGTDHGWVCEHAERVNVCGVR